MSRQPKNMTAEEMEENVIYKYLTGQQMTLEETAYAIWMHEGKKTPKPFSKIYTLSLEQRALAKLKKGLAKYGITSVGDVLDLGKNRQSLACNSAADTID